MKKWGSFFAPLVCVAGALTVWFMAWPLLGGRDPLDGYTRVTLVSFSGNETAFYVSATMVMAVIRRPKRIAAHPA